MLQFPSLHRDCAQECVVNSGQELIKAASAPAAQTIAVAQNLNDVPEIRLSPVCKRNPVLGGRRSHETDVQPIEPHGSIESLRIEGGFSSEVGTSTKSGMATSEP
jgi:hypothetical protein